MIKQTGGKSKYGNPIFCGKNEVPAGRVKGSAPRCFNMGMKVGFAAGIRKGREQGVPEGQAQAEAMFEAQKEALKEGQRRSNIKFGRAGESIGRAVGLREGRAQAPAPAQAPARAPIDINTLGQLRAKELVQLRRNQSTPAEKRQMTAQYGPTNRMSRDTAREFLRNEGLPLL